MSRVFALTASLLMSVFYETTKNSKQKCEKIISNQKALSFKFLTQKPIHDFLTESIAIQLNLHIQILKYANIITII